MALATADLVALFDVAEVGEGLPEPGWTMKPTNRVPVMLESAKGGDAAVRRLEPGRSRAQRPLPMKQNTVSPTPCLDDITITTVAKPAR